VSCELGRRALRQSNCIRRRLSIGEWVLVTCNYFRRYDISDEDEDIGNNLLPHLFRIFRGDGWGSGLAIIQLAFSCSNFRDARPTVSRRLRNYFRHPIAVICRRRLNGVIALSIKDLVLERVLRPEAARGGFRIAFCFREHVSQ